MDYMEKLQEQYKKATKSSFTKTKTKELSDIQEVSEEEKQIPSSEEEEEKKETNFKDLGYLQKCQKVGRIGKPLTQMDLQKSYGTMGDEDMALEVEARSKWVSCRANTGVFKGVWYYEVTLKTDGLMQIGWCTL